MVLAGIALGAGSFAKHVIGIGETEFLHAFGAFHRCADILAEDELPPHFAHRTPDGSADDRLSQTLDRAAQRFGGASLVTLVQDAARQHQRPC